MKKLCLLFTSLIIFIFVSCEIGLGSAVDTNPPSLSLSVPNPDTVEVIKGSFPIMGNYEDDGTISNIRVVISTAASDSKVVYEKDAELIGENGSSRKGKWKLLLNPVDERVNIADGAYQVSITAKDTAGRTTLQTSQIRIDNTPPLIILQRPSSVFDDETPDAYGRTFTLIGQSKDNNGVNLELQVFSDSEFTDAEPVIIKKESIPDTINLDFAKKGDSNYSSIYYRGDLSRKGTKVSYFKLTSYDNAISYQEDGSQTAADLSLGNRTDIYYLYDDIEDIISEYDINTLYKLIEEKNHIENMGRSISSSADNKAIQKLYDSNIIRSKGSFSLSPENNPSFTITGRSQLPEEEDKYPEFFANTDVSAFTVGGSLQIEIKPGLDETPLVVESLKPYAYAYDSQTGKSIEKIIPQILTTKKNGSIYKIEIEIAKENFTPGKNYVIELEGHDKDGRPVEAEGTGYGFHCSTNGEGPSIKITNPAEEELKQANNLIYKKHGDSFVIEGTVEYDNKGEFDILLNENSLFGEKAPISTENLTGLPEGLTFEPASQQAYNNKYNFSYTIPKNAFDQIKTETYVITIKASADRMVVQRTIRCLYDAKAPDAKILSISPIASKYEENNHTYGLQAAAGQYLNGTVTLKTSVYEESGGSGVNEAETYLEYSETTGQNASWTKIPDIDIKSKTNDISLDTKTLCSGNAEKTLYFKVTSKDNAGNISSENISGPYFVNQATDAPVILAGRDWVKIYESELEDGSYDTEFAENLLRYRKIYFTLIDDDGLSEIKVEAQKKQGDEFVDIIGEPIEQPDGRKKNLNFYFTSKEFESTGIFKLKVTVKDKYNKTSSLTTYFKINSSIPRISDVKLDNAFITTNSVNVIEKPVNKIQATFKIASTEAPFVITYQVKKDENVLQDWNYVKKENVALSTNGLYTIDIVPDAAWNTGLYDLQLKVTDNNGMSAIQNGTKIFNIDNERPEVSSITLPKADGSETEGEFFDFEINAIDTAGSSNLPAKYWIAFAQCDDELKNNPQRKTVWLDATDFKSYSLHFAQFKGAGEAFENSGYKLVYVKVEDAVGNISEEKSEVFLYDTSSPAVTINGETAFYTNSRFNLSGTVSDDWSIKKLTLKQQLTKVDGTQTPKTEDITSKISASGTWEKTELPLDNGTLENGTYVYIVEAEDKVGKKTTSSTVTVEVDQEKPEIQWNTPQSNVYSGLTALSGRASDQGLGVEKILHKIVKKGATAPSAEEDFNVTSFAISNDLAWRLSLDTKDGKNEDNISFSKNDTKYTLYEGNYALYVKAKDRAGNISSSTLKYDFIVDQNAPKITSISLYDTPLSDASDSVNYFKSKTTSTENIITGEILETQELDIANCSAKLIEKTSEGEVETLLTNSKFSIIQSTEESSKDKYSFTISDFVKENHKDKTIELCITLKDKAAKEVIYKYKLHNDNTMPAIVFLNPDKNMQGEESLSGEKYNFRATAEDSASGMESLKYLILKATNENDTGLSDEYVKVHPDLTAATLPSSLNIEKLLKSKENSTEEYLTEGKWFLYIYAKDKVGNEKVDKRLFWIDQQNPTLTVEPIKKTGQNINGIPVRNAGFTLSGTARDANGIIENGIEIQDGTKKYQVTPDSNGSWSLDFALGEGDKQLSEGRHNLVVTATDNAGKRTSITRSVFIDSNKPAGSISITSTPKEGWYDSQYISISVNPSDTGLSSGIFKVEARAESLSDADSSWTVLTRQESDGSVTYSGNILCRQQGSNTIKVKVTDNAGNDNYGYGGTVISSSINIDNVKPNFAQLISVDSKTDSEDLTGKKYINGRKGITIVVEAKDSEETEGKGSGIKTVSLIKPLKNGETPIPASQEGESNQWTVPIPKDKIGTGAVSFAITDKVGLTYTYTSDLSITRDDSAPEVKTINLPEDADKTNTDGTLDVNGTITLSGLTGDNRVVSQVDVSYYIDMDGKKGWTHCFHQEKKEDWEFTLNTKEKFNNIPDGTPVYLAVVVMDDVGNCNLDTKSGDTVTENHTSVTKTVEGKEITYILPKETITPDDIDEKNRALFYINQNSDRPVIILDDLNLDGMDNSSYFMYGSDSISVTVEDDDGDVKSVSYNIDDSKNEDNSIKWEKATLNNSSFMIDLKDGPHKILFKVKDKLNEEFETTATTDGDLMKIPVVTDGTNYFAKNTIKDTTIYVAIDDKPPVVNDDVEIKILNFQNSFGLFPALQNVGGTSRNQFLLKASAWDSNHIERIILSLDRDPNDPTDAELTREIQNTNYNDDPEDSTKGYRFDVELTDENAFNVQHLQSGIRSLTITAVDKAGKTAETKKMLKIINDPPAIRVVSHSEGDQEGSEFLLKAVVEGNENTIFRYQITENNGTLYDNKWEEIPYAASTRNIKINPREVVLSFVDYIKVDPKTGLVVYEEPKNEHEIGERYKDLNLYKVHFYAEDEFGNVNNTTSISLKLDPQGDIPVIKLTSPIKDSEEPDEYDALLSGIVRIAGSVTAKNPIKGIYLQIDPQYNKTDGFDENWQTKTLPNAVDASISGKTIEDVKDYLGYEIEEIGESGRYGIKIGTDTNWNFSFNKKSEFEKLTVEQGKTKYDNNTIAIRLYAYDGANITDSDNDIFVISLDAGAPRIGSSEPMYLRRYGWKDNNTGVIYYTPTENATSGAKLYSDAGCNVDAEKNLNSNYMYTPFVKQYEKDMWLEGEWFLTASVEDESGINEITVKDESVISDLQKKFWNAEGQQVVAADEKKTEGYILNYRIGSNQQNTHGILNYKITASDNDAKSTTTTVSIRYDNKKPRLEQYNLNTQNIYNRDGFYKVQSGAIEDDDESGFGMAVFYFKRTIDNYHYVYDTYRAYAEKNDQGAVLSHKANALSYDGSDSSVPAVSQGEEGLWWKTADYSEIDGSNITLTASEKFAHAGGLAKLNGAIYRIKAVNDTTVALEGTPSAASIGNILFAIGHVVDKEGSESEGSSRSDIITEDDCYGYYAHLIDDDGDKMIESVTPSDTSTIWAGAINSNNIPDGPIELHYVVFDKAGNYKSGLVTGLNVSNNAPRLAGLKVVSGLDEGIFYNKEIPIKLGANKYASRASELEDNCLVVSGNKKGPSDGGSSFMTVKDSIKFYPEIVGGNGNLYYTYKAGENLTNPADSGDSGDYSFAQGWNDGIDDYMDNTGYYRKDIEGTEYYEGHYTGYIEFTSNQIEKYLKHNSTDKPTWFEYTIWDSTAGTTKFVNSLKVSFQCALWIEYFDDKNPVLEDIKPLYWTSETDNSLYKHSRKQGHIELKAGISDELKAEPYSFGANDLVSGKITMRGTASDNIRVSKIYAKVNSPNNSEDTFLNDYTLIAEYKRNANNEMEWQSSSKGIAEDGWECKVTNDTSVSAGHKVNWEFSWDSEKLLLGAEKGVKLSFYVEDEKRGGSARRSGKKADGSFEDKTYTVDVVPYISHVKTSLSSALSNNPTVFDRTALGHYPVYLGESVTLEGFNLKDQTSLNVSINSLTLEEDTRTHSHSAKYKITVNGIDNINGLNNNALPYNMQKNGVNNDLLTDDLVFDVWKINSEAAKPTTGKNGNSISQPVMRINPSNGIIGFAFVNGSFFASMSDGTTNSYETWMQSRDICTSISFVYDDSGNSYGTIAGGDVDTKIMDKFNFVTNLWGNPTETNHNAKSDNDKNHPEYGTRDGKRALRLESIGTGFSGSLVYEKQRIQSPSIITATHGTDTNVYLAYYDNVNAQVRFKAGTLDTTTSERNANESVEFGNFLDSENSQSDSYDGRIKEDKVAFSNWKNSFQILANGTMTSGKAGSYVSLAVISGDTETTDTLIAVWYSSDGILWYSYNTTPITDRHNTSRDDTTTDDGWSTPVRVFSDDVSYKKSGMYCKVAVDAQKGVHIAGYDPVTRTLDYAYLNKDSAGAATSQSDFKTMVVDANGVTGKYLTLDVAMASADSNVGTPYIGYYSDSCQRAKMAYILNPEGLATAAIPGSNGKKVTGAWEITAVPTPSKQKLQSDLYNAINIGVWKNAGVISASTTGTETGKVYGNGSKNPVLAYAITAETIETAQKMGQ